MRLRALDRKLVRDLRRLRGQVFAIALVIASGVAVLVMSLGSLGALRDTAAAYYERARFAQVFATLVRAPQGLAGRIAAIPGVQSVETRITDLALLDLPGFDEPAIGQLLSIPERGQPLLNRLTLREGRSVAPGRTDEVVISEAFAEAQGLHPGDRFHALLNGRKRPLEVVGIALSPEFIYAMAPGALLPDDRRFGVLWMGREALAAAFDLDGAFNDVSLSLWRGARPEEVIERLDALLARYGGTGAYAREDQLSHWFLTSEIEQLASLAAILPGIFLAVAAFLTNMVLNRLIAIERAEIGLLKAFGYSDLAVGWHYAKLVLVIAALGVGLGSLLGAWFGLWTTRIYAEFYRFPFFFFRPGPGVFALAGAISAGSALLGTTQAVRRAVRLPPAEAMRPPAPARFRNSGLGAAVTRPFDQPTRILLRMILRHPARSAVTSIGIAMGVAVLVVALQWSDAIDRLAQIQFTEAQQQDLSVGLVDEQRLGVTEAFERLPGVLHAEPVRLVSARLRAGTRSHRLALQGVPADAMLQPVYDAERGRLPVPEDGLLVSSTLAEILDVARGDSVRVEVLEDARPVREARVAAVFETYLGTPAYMELGALNRLLRERPLASAAHLRIDPLREAELFRELKKLPEVAAVTVKRAALEEFHETMGETMLIFISIFSLFACMLVFGVAYNGTRVALSERARELATLRVLGLSRLEISYILLGEIGLLAFAGLPLGCAVGVALVWLITDQFATELYRVPLWIEPSTLGIAVLIAVVAVAVSALWVRRRLDRLDLVAVLKTRE